MEKLLLEMIEHIFSFLEYKEILKARRVCKIWNDEILRSIRIGKRKRLISWNDGGFIALGSVLKKTQNRFLFDTCSIDTDCVIETFYYHLFPYFGFILKTLELDFVNYSPQKIWPPEWCRPTERGSMVSVMLHHMFKKTVRVQMSGI